MERLGYQMPPHVVETSEEEENLQLVLLCKTMWQTEESMGNCGRASNGSKKS
jgi:hypothetical protein